MKYKVGDKIILYRGCRLYHRDGKCNGGIDCAFVGQSGTIRKIRGEILYLIEWNTGATCSYITEDCFELCKRKISDVFGIVKFMERTSK